MRWPFIFDLFSKCSDQIDTTDFFLYKFYIKRENQQTFHFQKGNGKTKDKVYILNKIHISKYMAQKCDDVGKEVTRVFKKQKSSSDNSITMLNFKQHNIITFCQDYWNLKQLPSGFARVETPLQ